MPNSYQINYDKRPVQDLRFKRKDFGLPKDAFIFSSFNHTNKIDPETFLSWMNILKRVPNAILWLLRSNKAAEKNLKKYAKVAGVNTNRVIFSNTIMPNEKHLARLRLSDLALDTFIYNGHTTTSDSLWVGVPVITLQGSHFASRVASSLLTAVGLPELITHSQKDYETLAIELATNPKKLEAIRKSLNTNRLTKPLFDTKLFVINLEKLYQKMYESKL